MVNVPRGWTKVKEGKWKHTEKNRASGYHKSDMGTPSGTTKYSKVPSLSIVKHDPGARATGVYFEGSKTYLSRMDKNERALYGYLVNYRPGHDNIRTASNAPVGWSSNKKEAKEMAQKFMKRYPKKNNLPRVFTSGLSTKSGVWEGRNADVIYYKSFVGTFAEKIKNNQSVILTLESDWMKWQDLRDQVMNGIVMSRSGVEIRWDRGKNRFIDKKHPEPNNWYIHDNDGSIHKVF